MKVGRLTPQKTPSGYASCGKQWAKTLSLLATRIRHGLCSRQQNFYEHARDYNILWLEEPIQWYDQLRGLAQVRAASRYSCRGRPGRNITLRLP